MRLFQVLLIQLVLIHLIACFWYLSATFEDNIWDTWVGARGIPESDMFYKYLSAFYWAFQTVTTVGYGDFSVSTDNEYYLCAIWMLVGVTFYSFTIGQVSSLIANSD